MIDLKQLMEERSAHPPVVADLRYPQIRRRVATRNRRRVALLATTAAVILAIVGGYAALPQKRVSPDPIVPIVPPSPARVSEGLPPYAFGRKLVHSETAPVSSQDVTITWEPTQLFFYLLERCSGVPDRVTLKGTMFVNGNKAENFTCSDGNSFHEARTEDWMRSGWIRQGEAITFTYVVEGASIWANANESPAPMPANGTIAAAIYVPIPFDQYPLPPRPAELPRLADWKACEPEHFIVSDPRNPLRPMSVTTLWSDVLNFRWDTQTPGTLGLAVDGVEFASLGWWDYGGLDWSRFWSTTNEPEWAGIPGWKFPAQGQQVTITFTPKHFTGAWQASLDHLGEHQDPRFC